MLLYYRLSNVRHRQALLSCSTIVDVNYLSPYLPSVSTDDTYILSRIDTRDVHINDMKFSGCVVYCLTMNQHTLVPIQLIFNTTPSIANKRDLSSRRYSVMSLRIILHNKKTSFILFESYLMHPSSVQNGRHVYNNVTLQQRVKSC